MGWIFKKSYFIKYGKFSCVTLTAVSKGIHMGLNLVIFSLQKAKNGLEQEVSDRYSGGFHIK